MGGNLSTGTLSRQSLEADVIKAIKFANANNLSEQQIKDEVTEIMNLLATNGDSITAEDFVNIMVSSSNPSEDNSTILFK
jgi:hypothetical protein